MSKSQHDFSTEYALKRHITAVAQRGSDFILINTVKDSLTGLEKKKIKEGRCINKKAGAIAPALI